MPQFGRTSQEKLSTCHPDLQKVMNEVVKILDITVLEGARTLETQKQYVAEGRSRTLNSKHLVQPDGYSHAVDIAPYPVNWNDNERFFFMGGIVMAIAHEMGINLRWGHDWDGDNDFNDQSFNDSPHFELRG